MNKPIFVQAIRGDNLLKSKIRMHSILCTNIIASCTVACSIELLYPERDLFI